MALSGQKTVTTAGTAVQLGTALINGPIIIKALDTNSGVVAIGNDGSNDVTVSNGLRLSAKETVELHYINSMSELYLDSAVNGEGVSWLALDV